MDFEDILDELEHKFVGTTFDWQQNVNCLKLQTIDGQHFDLLAPIIGVDFVAGLDLQNSDWLCFANLQVAKISPDQFVDDELPMLRNQEVQLADFIRALARPVRVVVKYQNQSELAINLLDADERFLIAEAKQLLPIQSIIQLRVLGTNKWQ
jgi:hypothetical protein